MKTMENILGAKGLTSSEANHVTNVVKELVKDLTADLKLSTSYITEDGENLPLDENKKVISWTENVQESGRLFGLSAWLKTAIKYKENLLNTVERKSFVSQLVKPTLEMLPFKPSVEISDYLNQLNTKGLNEYLTAEAMAAHVGKFIHNFDSIRRESDNFVPTSFVKSGDRTYTVKSTRLYTSEELVEGFFELQKEHRDAEKLVNLYKSRHHDWVKDTLEAYTSNVKSMQSRNFNVQIGYNNEVEAERLSFENDNREQKKVISAFKIIVPNELQPLLDEVNKYAKK